MNIICTCNGGFEDQLTAGKTYWAFQVRDNGAFLRTDKGKLRWFGMSKFKIEVDQDDLK